MPTEDVNPSKPITTYGGDSLKAVELRSWVLKTVNVPVGVMEILSRKSIDALSKETLVRTAPVQYAFVQVTETLSRASGSC